MAAIVCCHPHNSSPLWLGTQAGSGVALSQQGVHTPLSSLKSSWLGGVSAHFCSEGQEQLRREDTYEQARGSSVGS